jgi:C-terminal processing protease CtpA/Prc
MTAKLKDGHMFVFSPYREKHFYPPGYWKWIENRLVITKVFSDIVSLKKGDIIRKINGKKAKEYFSENQQYIPAPTDGYLNYRSQFAALRGSENETMKLSLISQEEKNKSVTLKHTISERTFQSKMKDHGPAFRRMNNGILYFDLTNMSFRKIKQRFDEIAQSRGVIFDMRGYPEQSVSYLLPHLMEQEDTIHDWLKSPIFVYPDQKNKNEYIESGWGLNPESPTIDKPVVFLANGKAISYAETCMQIVDYYKLGKIIGQPTAGTNGNVNSVDLPVGKLRFTGLKVTNLDGSQHFAKGVQPDIFVSQTIEGIRKGKDEYIERGVEYLKQQ